MGFVGRPRIWRVSVAAAVLCGFHTAQVEERTVRVPKIVNTAAQLQTEQIERQPRMRPARAGYFMGWPSAEIDSAWPCMAPHGPTRGIYHMGVVFTLWHRY